MSTTTTTTTRDRGDRYGPMEWAQKLKKKLKQHSLESLCRAFEMYKAQSTSLHNGRLAGRMAAACRLSFRRVDRA